MTMQCVLDGGRYFEGPRWHAGRLWFVDCWERTLLSLSPSGEREQHAKFEGDTPCGTGILPDGRLVVLTMFRKHLMSYASGRLSLYADLSGIATGTIDDGLEERYGELFQCIREFHVAISGGEVVGCAALRLLWNDLGEVRSLAVRPDFHGRGLGARLVQSVIEDARALDLPRIIALTREVAFFERNGFLVTSRDVLPRKVWSDCVRCPKRHACDEVAVVLDLVPGASEAAAAAARSWLLPIPQLARPEAPALPIIS